MTFQVCLDIGGTFTDCLVASETGEVSIFKAPTTPGEFHRGFIDALYEAAKGFELEPRDFIARIDLALHGSTVSTNALVERRVAKTGLILNEGHQDILVLREGPRKRAFEWRLDYPDPYIPRGRTRTVRGRINSRGEEIFPLSEDDIRDALQDFRRIGIEAIAVGLLWSVANPAHELAVRDHIHAAWPEIPITLSHEINPMMREYKRIIAAAIDASISPIIKAYVQDLEQALAQEGFAGKLLLANCLGGMMPVADMLRKPIYSVMSGPTLAPMAALALSEEPDIIVGDMGGTTFDVSALRNHQLIVTPDSMIHQDSLGIPKVDVRSVGAGGGSIAMVDEGGFLHVGPRSAGARPGPACYGLGGTEATVTDANVVLGLIDPHYFLGGRMVLRRDLAEAAIARIAAQMNTSLEQAAHAIYTTSNHNMVTAIEEITIREGLNPRDSYFVCGGGGTAAHIAEMADILGLKRYMIPRFTAGLSAFGGLISDIRWEQNGVLQTDGAQFDLAGVNALLRRLRDAGEDFLASAQIPSERRSFEYAVMGRYEYQSWEIEVPVNLREGELTPADIPMLLEGFHQMHERIYSIRADADLIEFTAWKVRAKGHRLRQNAWRDFTITQQDGEPRAKGSRAVYLHEEGGSVQLPIYDAPSLGAGARLAGPCILEAPTFTAVLKRGNDAAVDLHGNVHVTVASLSSVEAQR
ncbi:N-methylhydantoinase A [Rhodoligotrophos appendicifer]|uniref:hydantoinase/oxoprolinase family protein n=1 Tax=Rhodoligotrophos appendicifer TaxID=987056 RepID=UPI001186A84E|nr:hydantoinase/oxoprolinase family protein [Rhodoligotrophos appendicifer]